MVTGDGWILLKHTEGKKNGAWKLKTGGKSSTRGTCSV